MRRSRPSVPRAEAWSGRTRTESTSSAPSCGGAFNPCVLPPLRKPARSRRCNPPLLCRRRLLETLLRQTVGSVGGGHLRRIGAVEDLKQGVVDLRDLGEGLGLVEVLAL